MENMDRILFYVLLITGVASGAPPQESVQTMGEEVGPVGNVKIGDPFDDGVFDGVRRVTVVTDNIGVVDIKVMYVAKEEFQIREHGYRNGGMHVYSTFILAYPGEYITSINGSYNENMASPFVTSLVFRTSLGRISQTFGNSFGNINFVLEPEDGHISKLVGFFGTSDARYIRSLGARYDSPSSAAKKVNAMSKIVQPVGPQGGHQFDDGVFDGVRKVTIKEDVNGKISYVRIQYVVNDEFEYREHGAVSINHTEVEFEVDYPQEYIIAINISYIRNSHVTGLGFVTSYARVEMFGNPDYDSISYMLQPQNGRGSKLVGFLGRSDDYIYAIGARFYSDSSAVKNQSFYYFVGLVVVVMVMIF